MNLKANLFTCISFILMAFVLSTSVDAQKKANSKLDVSQTIMTIGSMKIPFSEVKSIYDKNSMKDGIPFEAISRDSAMAFLDLYSKYKVKVIDGKKHGFDKDSAVIEEIERNKRILAESFLLETEVIEPKIRLFTDRRKVERKIALIISHYDPNGDTVEAYNKIMYALKEIKNGATFEYAAKKYSSDTATGANGGVLPNYITGLRVQKNMEDPIFSLKVGEYTKEPIKTGYGYFLIKVLEESPRVFIGLSHILIPFKNNNVEFGPLVADTAMGQALADSLYNALKNGANFSELANEYSSDKVTSANNGNLGVYSRSTGVYGTQESIISAVESAAFSCKDGEVAAPVRSTHGFHIVRRDSTVHFPVDFELSDIKSNYNRIYFQDDKQDFYDSLAVALCKFAINEANFNKLVASTDSTKTAFDTNFINSVPAEIKDQQLFLLNGKNYTIGDFVETLISKSEYRLTATSRSGYMKAIKKLIEPIVVETATLGINKSHPQFSTIIEEFAAGIVLFKAEAANVWDNLKFDTLRAKKFYDTTTMDLQKPLQYDISEIYILAKDKADEVYNEIKLGKITFDSAAGEYTQRNAYRDKKGKYGLLNLNHKLAEQVTQLGLKEGEFSEPVKYEHGFSIIKLNGISPERRKTFEEALPAISAPVQSDYQKELEKQWLTRVMKENKIVFNNKVIDKIFGKK